MNKNCVQLLSVTLSATICLLIFPVAAAHAEFFLVVEHAPSKAEIVAPATQLAAPLASFIHPSVKVDKEGGGPAVERLQEIPRASVLLALKTGDSMHGVLDRLAEKQGFAVAWEGPDLFAKQDARFEGESFEDVANKLLIALRLNGYITKDEGKILHVFVQ